MKKHFILINFIFIFSIISCINQNKGKNNGKNLTINTKQWKIEKVQLIEQTRGVNDSVTFTATSKVYTSNNADPTNSSISPSEWESISKQAEALDLSAISKLQSPTTGRYSDRALAATIIITSGGTIYTSATFDSGHPPKELEALYNEIQKPTRILKKKP
ncbi:hypothetical protein [Chryseobacterium rhizosphaerae]|uniref:hypothetical protein n=1 Tax=Chryseobacterium rhizosphaerae TaxID=395937 RepID=UPI0023585CEC|nr:hypothetical protein [Chryseobacterium rhizosphaerae]MDC8101704.1 hypothetical protein [Chryseobacterium rhizosphaerae]